MWAQKRTQYNQQGKNPVFLVQRVRRQYGLLLEGTNDSLVDRSHLFLSSIEGCDLTFLYGISLGVTTERTIRFCIQYSDSEKDH